MISKPKVKLSVKVFCLSTAIIAACCIITYTVILRYAPYIYQKDPDIANELAELLADELENISYKDAPEYLDTYQTKLWEELDYEFELHIFNEDGEELDIYDLDYITGDEIDDYDENEYLFEYNFYFEDRKSGFTILVTENIEKQSQIAVALEHAAPIVTGVICLGSVIAAFFITVIITRPINRLYMMSVKMQNLNFDVAYNDKRTDEIGVLGRNLEELAQKLSSALEDLKLANAKLLADIEREREIERLQNDFFAAASHELKTPITIIKGNLEGMLYNVGRFADRDAYLARSLATTDRLQELVTEILSLTKMQSYGYESDFLAVNFSELIYGILFGMRDLFEQKQISLLTDVKRDIFICGNSLLLKKAVSNILSNAVVHTPNGEQVFAELSVNNNRCVLNVINTGVHIKESDLNRLFEPFYRPDASRSSKTGGSGLGLYIAKRAADLSNAKISISNTDLGVEVVLELNLYNAGF